jgi:hypothetical protein
MAEHCRCPGPNDVAATGCCDRCGFVGSQREAAIKSALASGRHQLATELGRQEGLLSGYRLGLGRGRAEKEANAEADRDAPFRRVPEFELEAG